MKKMKRKCTKHLRRGMRVQMPDGSIEVVTAVFRFPANTKFRKKGCVMFQSKNYIWWPVYADGDVKILGF